METLNLATVVLLFENDQNWKTSRVLGVSRKHNQSDFGLVGGKVEIEEYPTNAIIRETFEETGIRLKNPKLIDIRFFIEDDKKWYIFLYTDSTWDKNSNFIAEENTIVKFLTWNELMSGTFKEYNTEIYNELDYLQHKFENLKNEPVSKDFK